MKNLKSLLIAVLSAICLIFYPLILFGAVLGGGGTSSGLMVLFLGLPVLPCAYAFWHSIQVFRPPSSNTPIDPDTFG